MTRTIALLTAAAAAVLAQPAAAQTLETVARGLVEPWALAFAPDGRMLVTERAGRLRAIGPDGRPGEPIEGLGREGVTGRPALASPWLFFSTNMGVAYGMRLDTPNPS